MSKPELRQRARDLRQLGKSIIEIAKDLGVAKSSVSSWVRDLPQPEEFTSEFRAARRYERESAIAEARRQKILKRQERQDKGPIRKLIEKPEGYKGSTIGNGRYVLEHRYLMEQQLGRLLKSDEMVQHLNDDISDNRIENLSVVSKSDYNRKYYNDRKAEVIELLGGKCTVCGSTEDLEVDHIDESIKELDIIGNWSKQPSDKLRLELKKCQLLCFFHHQEKSIAYVKRLRAGRPIRHGTWYSVQKRKCSCSTCNEARTLYNEKRRELRKETIVYTRGPYKPRGLHGDSRYRQGCRCETCTTANRERKREYRRRRFEQP